jgi:hypothetical protein
VATLAQRLADLTAAVRAKFNLVTPRLLPAGGQIGQALRKASAADYDAAWSPDWTYVKLAVDFTTSAIAATDTPLAFTPAAGKTYEVQGLLLLRTSLAAAGPRPGLAFPTGLTDQIAQIIVGDSATTAVLAHNTGAATMQAVVTGLPNATTSWFGRFEALLIAGVTPAGAFRVQLASETAGRAVTVKAGSYLRYREL